MKPSSAKAKGRRLQQALMAEVQGVLAEAGLTDPDHVRNRPMGSGGEDLILSPTAREWFPFSPECKNTERLSFWATVEQASRNCPPGAAPLLCVAKNRTTPYIAVPMGTFFKMLRLLARLLRDSPVEAPSIRYGLNELDS